MQRVRRAENDTDKQKQEVEECVWHDAREGRKQLAGKGIVTVGNGSMERLMNEKLASLASLRTFCVFWSVRAMAMVGRDVEGCEELRDLCVELPPLMPRVTQNAKIPYVQVLCFVRPGETGHKTLYYTRVC